MIKMQRTRPVKAIVKEKGVQPQQPVDGITSGFQQAIPDSMPEKINDDSLQLETYFNTEGYP